MLKLRLLVPTWQAPARSQDGFATQENGMAGAGLPQDMFEWMQTMWNPMSFPIPGLLTPTADPKEIEKKIRELKTIETWLTMNVGFVQMSIKTLEMQKAALESIEAATGKNKNI
jgi:hypothetical protein